MAGKALTLGEVLSGLGEASRGVRFLQGEARGVIRGIRRMTTERGLGGKRVKDVNRACNYLENNLERMRYDEYLAAGYPIASGVIEGACRHLVKDRMERAGMRWTIDGAQAMLDLRSTYINDQWAAFQTHRITTETARLYPKRHILQQLTWQLAA